MLFRGEKGKIKMFERPAITDIVLTRVNFSDRLDHVLDFTNVNEQTTFFDNLPNKLVLEDATFQRKDMYIRMDGKYDTIQLYNYGWYHNNIENMRYYFFIENVQYASDNSCLIYIKIDPWQTYQFQLKYIPTFIERKHVTDDVAGNYTFPEGLETGEYIVQNEVKNLIDTLTAESDIKNYYVVAFATLRFDETADDIHGKNILYNGMISGANYVLFKDLPSLKATLKYYNDNGKADEIITIMNFPAQLYPIKEPTWYESTVFTGATYSYVVRSPRAYFGGNITITKPIGLGLVDDVYIPRNKKLLVYPYTTLIANNHAGNVASYMFEDFITDYPIFRCEITITPSGGGLYIPLGYKNNLENTPNYDEAITIDKFPLGSFNSNTYTNWLAQNYGNISTNALVGGGKLAIGGIIAASAIASGGTSLMIGAGLAGSGLVQELGLLGSVMDHSAQPDQVGGTISNNIINYSLDRALPSFYTMTIKKEYAMIIDNFFDKYGYKINKIETPNIRTRKNWNYIKTVDINFNIDLVRPIPQEYMDALKLMFDGGVTIWHNYNTMYNYNSDNSNL